jgi:hypothetical protein
MKNAYPELPIVKCVITSINMDDINSYIKTIPYITEVKRITQIIIRNETGNGHSFLCNNGCGQQADGARLDDKWIPYITGTFVKNENMTGKQRIFCAFKDWTVTAVLLADKILHRGMFIGENVDSTYYKGNVKTPQDAAQAYWDEWVEGDSSKPSQKFIDDFVNMYNKSTTLFV